MIYDLGVFLLWFSGAAYARAYGFGLWLWPYRRLCAGYQAFTVAVRVGFFSGRFLPKLGRGAW